MERRNFIVIAMALMVLTSVHVFAGSGRIEREYWDEAKTKPKNVHSFDDEGRQSGEWITWYENGQMKSKTSFYHGDMLLFESWYDNGNKSSQEPFAEGLAHGLWIWWGPDGKIIAKSYFSMGTGVEYYFTPEGKERKRVIWVSGVEVSSKAP